jgi:hypothetical protein
MAAHTKRSKGNGKTYTYRYYYCHGQHSYRTQCRQSELVRADKVEGAVLDAIVEVWGANTPSVSGH